MRRERRGDLYAFVFCLAVRRVGKDRMIIVQVSIVARRKGRRITFETRESMGVGPNCGMIDSCCDMGRGWLRFFLIAYRPNLHLKLCFISLYA